MTTSSPQDLPSSLFCPSSPVKPSLPFLASLTIQLLFPHKTVIDDEGADPNEDFFGRLPWKVTQKQGRLHKEMTGKWSSRSEVTRGMEVSQEKQRLKNVVWKEWIPRMIISPSHHCLSLPVYVSSLSLPLYLGQKRLEETRNKIEWKRKSWSWGIW